MASGVLNLLTESLYGILKVLDYTLCTREFKLVALHEYYIVKTLFSLLQDVDPSIRAFSLRVITDLMIAADSRVPVDTIDTKYVCFI